MTRILPFVFAIGMLGACATEPPQEPPAPLPVPPAPPRVPANRAAASRPAPAAAVPPSAPAEPTATPAAAVAAAPAWRVVRDGVVGCADRAALSLLREAAEGMPRLLAEARAAGGCRTTFRVNEWVLEATQEGTVRLRLTNGAPLTLWFQRGDVAAP